MSVVAKKIDPDDLVDSAEVAEILGLSNAGAVRVYRGRYEDFPAPVIERGRCVLWGRADIAKWKARRA